MARSEGMVNAVVVFIKPAAFPDAWEQTDLWESAARIPGVNVMRDDEGIEARRFGSQTSGQTMLYAADGQLLFSGGITEGRGHSGENDGRNAIVSLLSTGSSGKTATSVYGCPLFNEPTSDETPDNSCHAVSDN